MWFLFSASLMSRNVVSGLFCFGVGVLLAGRLLKLTGTSPANVPRNVIIYIFCYIFTFYERLSVFAIVFKLEHVGIFTGLLRERVENTPKSGKTPNSTQDDDKRRLKI